jgi:hypothetical protein
MRYEVVFVCELAASVAACTNKSYTFPSLIDHRLTTAEKTPACNSAYLKGSFVLRLG